MYCLPWNGVIISGTTEDSIDKIVTHPVPKGESIQFILNEMQMIFPDEELKY